MVKAFLLIKKPKKCKDIELNKKKFFDVVETTTYNGTTTKKVIESSVYVSHFSVR